MTAFLAFVLSSNISHRVNLQKNVNVFLFNCMFKHQRLKDLGIGPMLFRQFLLTLEALIDFQINWKKHLLSMSYSWCIINHPAHQLFILTFNESTAVFSSSSSFTRSWHFCLISAWEIPKSFWKMSQQHYIMWIFLNLPVVQWRSGRELLVFRRCNYLIFVGAPKNILSHEGISRGARRHV